MKACILCGSPKCAGMCALKKEGLRRLNCSFCSYKTISRTSREAVAALSAHHIYAHKQSTAV